MSRSEGPGQACLLRSHERQRGRQRAQRARGQQVVSVQRQLQHSPGTCAWRRRALTTAQIIYSVHVPEAVLARCTPHKENRCLEHTRGGKTLDRLY